MRSPKSKTASPSRSSHRVSRSRATAPAVRRSTASRNSTASAKTSEATANKTSLARKVLAKVKTKTGIAVVAGAVLAGVGGLAYKYRAAR